MTAPRVLRGMALAEFRTDLKDARSDVGCSGESRWSRRADLRAACRRRRRRRRLISGKTQTREGWCEGGGGGGGGGNTGSIINTSPSRTLFSTPFSRSPSSTALDRRSFQTNPWLLLVGACIFRSTAFALYNTREQSRCAARGAQSSCWRYGWLPQPRLLAIR